MDVFKISNISELIGGNPYVGRGIIVGRSADGRRAVAAYFIMGRSENSRNRIFVKRDGVLYTHPFDPAKVSDPSLIIYPAVKKFGNKLIVTNGDQTDTIYHGFEVGKSFFKSLEERTFEPDAPNFTPRISAVLDFADGDFSYDMSILKSVDAAGSACARYGFSYPSVAGLGHFIHTYVTDGNPLPPFYGEPERVAIPDDIEVFANDVWNALDANNKISLYVVYTDLGDLSSEEIIINKNV